MIITHYSPDGVKKRETVGYGGGLCHQASAPYEAREATAATKTATAEACQAPASQAQTTEEALKVR